MRMEHQMMMSVVSIPASTTIAWTPAEGGESAHASSCMVATNSWVKLVEGQAGCSIILTSIAAVHRAVSSDLDWLHLLHCRA